jgi:predicted DNA-binding transcriptional regulator AlpA
MPKAKSSNRSAPPSGEFLTLAQVACELHLSVKSIQRRIARGEFCPFVRVGRRMLWSKSQLLEWFKVRATPTGITMQRRTRRVASVSHAVVD